MDLFVQLETYGGSQIHSEMISNMLMNHKKESYCIIPDYAHSGGTHIALASSKIIVANHATLTPIDPQIDQGIVYGRKQVFPFVLIPRHLISES